MNEDKIKIEILKDGTIKITTDPISGANHTNAEGFLRFIAETAGGTETIQARTDHAHHHHHDHDHAHQETSF